MKKVIKLVIIAIFAFAILSIYNTSLAVTSGRVTLTPSKSSYEPGSEVVVSVDISDLTATTAFVEFGGVVKYDKDVMTLTAINSNLDGIGNAAKDVFTYGITAGSQSVNKNVCNLVFKLNDTFEGDTDVSLEVDLSGTQGKSTVTTSVKVETPAPSEPDVSEPDASEPSVSEPSVSEPSVSEPSVSEPDASEPSVSEPSVSEPNTSQPDTSKPTPSTPDTSEPSVSKPEESSSTTNPPSVSSSDKNDDNYQGTLPDAGEHNNAVIIALITSVVVIAIAIVLIKIKTAKKR